MKYYRRVLTKLIDEHCFIPGIAQPINGVEVGVAAGKTSAHLLATFPTLHLTCVDRWLPPYQSSAYAATRDMFANSEQGDHDKRHAAAIEATRPYRQRVTLLQASSENVAYACPELWFDFVFVDGDHSYDGVIQDLSDWWTRVRPGGLFCGHDYDPRVDDNGLDARGRGVAKAVKQFFSGRACGYVVGEGSIWWSIKPQS